MRIDELNMFQNLLKGITGTASNVAKGTNTGGVGSAFLRSRKSGLSTTDQLAQDIFVKKFVSRGINAINTAIDQELADPKSGELGGAGAAATSAPGAAGGAASPAAAAAGQPAAAGQGKAATGAKAGGPSGSKAPGDNAIPTGQKQGAAKPDIDVNVDKIVSGMRTLQPAGNKPVPPESKIAKEIMADLPKVSLNKDYLIRVGDKILKLNNAGYDVKDLHRQFMGQYAKGNKQKTIQESIEESRLEELYHRARSSERFKNALKKAGYDPDLAIRRMSDLLAKRKQMASQRDELIDIDEVSPQGGGRVAGAGLSQTPNAIRKREARAKAKAGLQSPPGINPATGKPFAPKAAAGQQPGAKKPAGQQQAAPKAAAAPSGQQQAPAGQQQAAPAKGDKPSISQWFKTNFMDQFLKGIDVSSAEPQINKILANFPKSLAAGSIEKDLQSIASIAWTLSNQGKDKFNQPSY